MLVYVMSTISEMFLRIDGTSLIFEKNLFMMGNSLPTACRKDFIWSTTTDSNATSSCPGAAPPSPASSKDAMPPERNGPC